MLICEKCKSEIPPNPRPELRYPLSNTLMAGVVAGFILGAAWRAFLF